MSSVAVVAMDKKQQVLDEWRIEHGGREVMGRGGLPRLIQAGPASRPYAPVPSKRDQADL